MKKQPKENPASIKSRARSIMRENKDALPELLKALAGDGLPEHDSPFKLYFNGKLIGSAGANQSDEPLKNPTTMKTIETRKRFSNADHTALLQTKCDNLLARIKLKGQEYGKSSLPLLQGDSMKLYFAPFFFEYQAMLDSNNAAYQCEVTCFEVSENDKFADRTIADMEHELADTKHGLIPIESELKNTSVPAKRLSVPKTWMCICIVGGLDTLLNTQYFEMLGFDYLQSFAIGVFFAMVLLIFSHFVPRLIKLGNTKQQQRIISGGIVLFMSVLFWHLALLRTAFSNTTTGDHQSPVFFTALSLFLFFVAVCIYLFLMPSKTERDAIERYHALCARRQTVQDTIGTMTNHLITTRAAKSEFRVENSSIILSGGMTEKLVITNAHRGFAELKAELMRYRTERPDCLNDDFPFTFHRYFTQID